jgi:hypothetical protein
VPIEPKKHYSLSISENGDFLYDIVHWIWIWRFICTVRESPINSSLYPEAYSNSLFFPYLGGNRENDGGKKKKKTEVIWRNLFISGQKNFIFTNNLEKYKYNFLFEFTQEIVLTFTLIFEDNLNVFFFCGFADF